VAIWLGLALTTPPATFPLGLSFAQVQVSNQGVFLGNGWRIMYVVGAVLALIGIVLRIQLPESPRWLVSRGRVAEADAVVRRMEQRASGKAVPAAQETMDETPPQVQSGTGGEGFGAIFRNPKYVGRVVLLFLLGSLRMSRCIRSAPASPTAPKRTSGTRAKAASRLGPISAVFMLPLAYQPLSIFESPCPKYCLSLHACAPSDTVS
jgi:MFS family permease